MTRSAEPGTYVLLLRLRRAQRLRIGALGVFEFPPGWYVYVGSAFGPGGLAARVARHARLAKRLRWHIDYLLPPAELYGVWAGVGWRQECELTRRIASGSTARICAERFGASDCDCRSHLFYFVHRPDLRRYMAGAQWWSQQACLRF
jgi:Uri superfamily endonuclease